MARISDDEAAAKAAANPPREINLDAGRRAFFKASGLAMASASMIGIDALAGAPAEAQTAGLTDVQILNFALNLEYLEANFYSIAVSGQGLTFNDTVGVGGSSPGGVIGGRKATFTDPLVADYANEIANDEIAHVRFLRRALGSSAVGQPNIDIGGAFTTAAVAAGVIQQGQTFDPYADDVSFLLGSYIFEDVGVTAYHGAAPLISNKDYLRAAAGILSVEAYHAGIIRTTLFAKQMANPSLPIFTATRLISALRYKLSNPGTGVADDQGIAASESTISNGPATFSNLVPTDGDSLAFARLPSQVSNIVYGAQGATKGLFFPVGLNPGNPS
jgi:hypothetical protein